MYVAMADLRDLFRILLSSASSALFTAESVRFLFCSAAITCTAALLGIAGASSTARWGATTRLPLKTPIRDMLEHIAAILR
jgi:hypothetical protein